MAWVDRYVTSSGSGTYAGSTNSATPMSLATAQTSAAPGDRINVQSGTYSEGAANIAFGTAGTTTAPIWWRGYHTTPGDCDSDPTLARPILSFTTGSLGFSAAFNIVTNFDVTGANTSGLCSVAGSGATPLKVDRVRITNTAASAGASALVCPNSHQSVWTRCRFQVNAAASAVVDCSGMTGGPGLAFAGCVFAGGGDGIRIAPGAATAHFVFHKCCFRAVGGSGIVDSGASGCVYILDCSFQLSGTDGLRCSATISGGQVVVLDSAFGDNGGYGINNSSGTNTGWLHRVCNLFGHNTSGLENGMGDTPSLSQQSDGASSPFASSSDQTLAVASTGRANAIPVGTFPGETFANFADIGAVQHQDAGGGSGGLPLTFLHSGGRHRA